MSLDPLVRRVASTCLGRGLLVPGERVLVAASAGADSTALALLLAGASEAGLPLDLRLAHVDHGWRGPAEAKADQAVILRLARRLDLDLVLVPPPDPPARSEDAARRFRYRALDRAARDAGCAAVATGHHLRDQAETVLMRVLRGSGAAGLRGIPWRRPLGEGGLEVVRPLLDVAPGELRAYLERVDATWREDVTNADSSRDRARARRRLLELEARGGTASKDLALLADRLRARLDRITSRIDESLERALVVHPLAAAVEVPRELLARLPLTHLDLALRRLGATLRAERDGPWFTRRHVVLVAERLADGGAVDLPRGMRFETSGARAWLRRLDAPRGSPRLERQDADAASFDLEAFLATTGPDTAALDAGVLGGHPRLRTVRPGDRFRPTGREPDREVLVSRWLTKRQVPHWLRRVQLVVAGERGVAWVVGHRVDRRHAVTSDTEAVALLRVD